MHNFVLFACALINVCHGSSYKYLKDTNSRLIGRLFHFQFPSGRYNSSAGFLGIRYAKAPVGQLRFQPPVEVNWENKEYNLENEGNQCMRMENGKVVGSEDCLTLNVYVPTGRNKPSEMPTIVYFNNPSYVKYKMYTNTESPLFLLRNNLVVLYVVNYRTGPFGFLHTRNHTIPGNIGLKDQLMAMEWITKNNHLFNGKSPFTIIGDFDSASHAYLHMFSGRSKGLFNALITHNSDGFGTWKIPRDTSHLTRLLARKLYCYYEHEELLLEFLQDVDAEDIILATASIDEHGEGIQHVFKPIIEGEHPDAILPLDPFAVLSSEGGSDIPWLNGRITQSGLRRANEFLQAGKSLNNFDFRQLLPDYIVNSENDVNEMIGEIKKIYTNNTCNTLINMFTDFDILASNDAMMLQYLYRQKSVDKYLISFVDTNNYQNNLCGLSKNIFQIPDIASIKPDYAVTSINWRFVAIGNQMTPVTDEEYLQSNMEETNERIDKIRNIFSKYAPLKA